LSPPESLVSVDVASIDEIQRLLDADTTLVEYFVTERGTLSFMITRDSFRFHSAALEVSRENLTNKIEAFRRFASLKNPHPKSLQQLYEWLIAPLKPYLKTSQLAIVPHGVLHYLPFAALSNGERYLCDDYTITTLPSASILRFLPQKRKPSTSTLLALGNPTTTDLLPRLRFAEQEVNAIASLYNTQPLVGAAATKSTVLSQSGNAEILHLAVHGQFNKHNPLFSTLYLAADSEHDGRLEVHDIYTLDLTEATNLVVLSACQTQLGELSKGDEVIGLNRAFLYAGTPSVIATLWSVNDKVTGLLMERFYTHLRSGMALAQALRIAQMDIRVEYPHPYYWAAFVLTGNGGHVSEAASAHQARSNKT
jgi:CHAT domain-containing protein